MNVQTKALILLDEQKIVTWNNNSTVDNGLSRSALKMRHKNCSNLIEPACAVVGWLVT